MENDFKATIENSILILLFEFIGATFLTLLYLCHSEVLPTDSYIIRTMAVSYLASSCC